MKPGPHFNRNLLFHAAETWVEPSAFTQGSLNYTNKVSFLYRTCRKYKQYFLKKVLGLNSEPSMLISTHTTTELHSQPHNKWFSSAPRNAYLDTPLGIPNTDTQDTQFYLTSEIWIHSGLECACEYALVKGKTCLIDVEELYNCSLKYIFVLVVFYLNSITIQLLLCLFFDSSCSLP